MRFFVCAVLCSVALGAIACAQETESYSRKNTWTTFAEYSGTSSHILMGESRQRKLTDLGFGYARRLVRFAGSDLSYQAEVRPVLFESDPLTIDQYTETFTTMTPPLTYSGVTSSVSSSKCVPYSYTDSLTPVGGTTPEVTIVNNITCGRQWTAGQAFSPLGFKWAARSRHAVQPFFTGTLGYMYTSRPVPVADAESFNFLFNFGPGVEIFRHGKRSIAVEYRFSHFSNRDTAAANPGVDNMMLKVSYSFGR